MVKKFISVIAVLACTLSSIAQTNYYVKPSGDDNNSGLSLSEAWQTIQKAADELQAGDTVFIKSGLYNEIVIPTNSGTATHYITYIAYPGDVPIIDGTNFANTYLQYTDRGVFDIKYNNYINVIGLTIQHSNAGGIMCRYGSSYINIINNNIRNCQATGIGVGYSRGNLPMATNINAYGNFLDSCSITSRESISFRSVDTFNIYNNIVKNTPKEAIDAKSGCSNGKIFKNSISNAGSVGIYIDAGYPDSLYESQHDIFVFQNTVYNSTGSYVVSSEAGCLGRNIWFYNNIAYDSTPHPGNGICVANFELSGPLENIYIINNTFYGKGHRGIYINNLNVRNIFIRNNICSQNAISQIDVKSALIDSLILENNIIDGINVDDGDFPIFGSPGFSNVGTGDFHLLTGSQAIDNGSSVDAPTFDFDGIIRPSGAGYDIGAYEYDFSQSINENSVTDDIFCYPNPTYGILIIKGECIQQIQVITVEGQVIEQVKADKETVTVNLSNNVKGVYFIKIFYADPLDCQKK